MNRIFLILFSAIMPTVMLGQTNTPETIVVGPQGLTVGQTARLNVLAPGLPAPFATGVRCPATLAILSSDGSVIKSQDVVVNPNQILSLDVTDAEAAALGRVQLSGKVLIPPAGTAGSYCTLVPTFEIFDTATGKTTAVVGNAYTVGGPARSSPANAR